MLVKLISEKGNPAVVPLIRDGLAIGNVLLVPGWNEIKPADFQYCKETMALGVEQGLFEYRGKKGEDDEVIECPLSEIRADIAKKMVQECFNPTNLNEWKDDSKLTSELRNAVDIQIQKIAEVE